MNDTRSPAPTHEPTQTDRLTNLIDQKAELWHASDGRTFATALVGLAKRSFLIEGT